MRETASAARGLYRNRLRQLVAAVLPPEVSAEILAAYEGIIEPVGDVSVS